MQLIVASLPISNEENEGKRKATSNNIAAATRPRVKGHTSSFCLKLESLWNPLDLSMES